jgi:hypothetical protein
MRIALKTTLHTHLRKFAAPVTCSRTMSATPSPSGAIDFLMLLQNLKVCPTPAASGCQRCGIPQTRSCHPTCSACRPLSALGGVAAMWPAAGRASPTTCTAWL